MTETMIHPPRIRPPPHSIIFVYFMSAWHDRVGDFTLFEALTGGAFDRQNGNTAGNLTKIFQKSQMPQGLPGGDGRFWN